MDTAFYDQFYSKDNLVVLAKDYAEQLHNYNNSSRSIDNLTYKLRKEIKSEVNEARRSLPMKNFMLFVDWQYDRHKMKQFQREKKALKAELDKAKQELVTQQSRQLERMMEFYERVKSDASEWLLYPDLYPTIQDCVNEIQELVDSYSP